MIEKVKTVWHVTLPEARMQLRLDDDFTRDDAQILTLIKVAHEIAENEIQKDIAKTTNVLTRYDFAGDIIRINEGNCLSVTTVEIKESETPLSNFTTFVMRDRFRIELDAGIDTEELTVTFETGFDSGKCPFQIKQAILIKISDLYDIYRASAVAVPVKETGFFENLLAPFKASHVTHEQED